MYTFKSYTSLEIVTDPSDDHATAYDVIDSDPYA